MSHHHFAILIPARNEEDVIGELISSLRAQNYPKEFFDIYVLADNCSDGTAKVAMENGAIVYKWRHTSKNTKGYVIDYLVKQIKKSSSSDKYDAYIVFDADNIVDENFLKEIDKVYSRGFNIVTSYRNVKNFADNWLAGTSGIFCLYQSKVFRCYSRQGRSCKITGTGFLVSKDILEKYGGWKFYSLGEDIEFSIQSSLDGFKIGYADKAITYDEQPSDFLQFCRQRIRWVRAHFQVAKIFRGEPTNKYADIDLLTITTAIMFVSIVDIILCLILQCFLDFNASSYIIIFALLSYIPVCFVGLTTIISEWARIKSSSIKKVVYALAFPFMILLFIFLSVVAIFTRNDTSWKKIKHGACCK